MATTKRDNNFFDSEEGVEIKRALYKMEADSAFNTEASYSANAAMYPNNRMPFADKHMNYLKQHQDLDPQQYLSNLRLMTKIN